MAGYFGCGHEIPDGVPGTLTSDGSNLVLRFFSSGSIDATSITNNVSSATIVLDSSISNLGTILAGTTLGISDCTTAELFSIGEDGISEDGLTITTSASLNHLNYQDAEVHLYRTYTYTVNGTDLLRNGAEMVEGVEAWELLFGLDGVDIGSEPDSYVTAATVAAASALDRNNR